MSTTHACLRSRERCLNRTPSRATRTITMRCVRLHAAAPRRICSAARQRAAFADARTRIPRPLFFLYDRPTRRESGSVSSTRRSSASPTSGKSSGRNARASLRWPTRATASSEAHHVLYQRTIPLDCKNNIIAYPRRGCCSGVPPAARQTGRSCSCKRPREGQCPTKIKRRDRSETSLSSSSRRGILQRRKARDLGSTRTLARASPCTA